MSVPCLLSRLGLSRYAELFEEEAITSIDLLLSMGPDMLRENLEELGLEPDGNGTGLDHRAGLILHKGPAPGSDDFRLTVDQALEHAALQRTELRLTIFFKDFADAHAGGVFDLGVGVEEIQTEQRRQRLSEAGLATAHQSDKNNRTVDFGPQFMG